MDTTKYLKPSSAVEDGLEPEPKIEDFEQIKTLGEGGFGKVILCKHKVTGAEYAIKIMDKQKFSQVQKELLYREVEMMYKIKHPNIVRIYSHFEDERYCYIVIEYIKKGNVYDYQKPLKVLDAKTTANFVVDLISSLYYLHNLEPKIIHRDIKPENLLLGDDGHLKLSDFGASNYIEGNTKRNTTCGTGIYHPPEMLTQSGYDHRVDIWAIGILIFELMVGKSPFKAENGRTMNDNICNVRIHWPDDKERPINDLAKKLIKQILQKDPRKRPKLEEILKHPFITSYVSEAESSKRLVKPSQFDNEPFVISKQMPNEDFLTFMRNLIKNSNGSRGSDDNQEGYKELYEKLKISYDKIEKELEDVMEEKQNNDSKNNQKIKLLTRSKELLLNDYYAKVDEYYQQNNKISKFEDEIKELKKQNELLNQKLTKAEKDLKATENNNKIKLASCKADNKKYIEKIKELIKNNGTGDIDIIHDINFNDFSDNNLIFVYKAEIEKLHSENNNYLKIIKDLENTIAQKEAELKSKELSENNGLVKIQRDRETEMAKKEYLNNKLYDTIFNISSFMNKIKMNNFEFTLDGHNLGGNDFIKRMVSNTISSNDNSMTMNYDDKYSSKSELDKNSSTNFASEYRNSGFPTY